MPQLIILYLIAAYFFSIWPFEEDDKWDAFVYPNRDNLTVHQRTGAYKTLEMCRAASIGRLRAVSSVEKGDYECGLNCEPNEYGMNICEETLR